MTPTKWALCAVEGSLAAATNAGPAGRFRHGTAAAAVVLTACPRFSTGEPQSPQLLHNESDFMDFSSSSLAPIAGVLLWTQKPHSRRNQFVFRPSFPQGARRIHKAFVARLPTGDRWAT